jgi:UDP-N-acetylglucosamine acyltransferase
MSADLKIVNSGVPGAESGFSDSAGHPVIDKTASVHKDTFIGTGTIVGPYAVIGAGVELGKNCIVHSHAVITGPAKFGDSNEFFSFSCIGGAPQDLRHKGEPTTLNAGDRNVFREYVTVSRGTVHGGGVTEIGSDNLIMAYRHIAHDCIIGNRVVMANNATLAGHVKVDDFAVFGGMVAVASFIRIGESAMLAAGSMVDRNVPPFSMVAGNRAVLQGTNRVGLMRRGFDSAARLQIKQILKRLKRKDDSLQQTIETYRNLDNLCPESARLIDFLSQVTRGITR